METKYYHIHVNYGDNVGFSVFFHLTPINVMNEINLIDYAIDSGLIESDDQNYVDEVNEITKKDFNDAMANSVG